MVLIESCVASTVAQAPMFMDDLFLRDRWLYVVLRGL